MFVTEIQKHRCQLTQLFPSKGVFIFVCRGAVKSGGGGATSFTPSRGGGGVMKVLRVVRGGGGS